jgi:poly-beta-1,6-N-acetyl-D-glucosamine synthase
MTLSYVAITPARDEAENLPRLAESMAAQNAPPSQWIIVDNGSTDSTPMVVRSLSETRPWIRLLSRPGTPSAVRGSPIVEALQAAFETLEEPPDIVVNVDADVSFGEDYMQRLLSRFANDKRLGIASGGGLELVQGKWRPRYLTGSTVWGATRAYRWSCLQQVLPLEPRLGWDGIDELKANAAGWRTKAFPEIPFHHHRREGARDGRRGRARLEQGRAAHYMGYRVWYLALRAVYQTRRDRAAPLMLVGYVDAALRRSPKIDDAAARNYLRRQQNLCNLPARAREALGRKR